MWSLVKHEEIDVIAATMSRRARLKSRCCLIGKVALVTGGSRGIGRAVSMRLASEGAHVAINYLRNDTAAASLSRRIQHMGRRSLLLKGNVGNPSELDEMFSRFNEVFQRLDILVHCASLGSFQSVRELSMVQLNRVMNINCNAMVISAQRASRLMRRGASIVGISSLGSQRAVDGYAAVGIAKAALEAAIRYLALALAEKGIRVNGVSGGPVDTEGLRAIPGYRRRKQLCLVGTPMGRLGRADDIANVVLFLVKPESAWVCGQTVIADGGLSLRLLTL